MSWRLRNLSTSTGSVEAGLPQTPGTARRFIRNASLGARLTLGFGLIAALFMAANYVSERNAASIATQIKRSNEINRQFDQAAHSLTDALTNYHRAVRTGAAASNSAIASKTLSTTEAAMSQAVKEYAQLKAPIPGSLPATEIADAVRLLQHEVNSLIDYARRREELMARYWSDFDKLQEKFRDPRKTEWSVGDRVVTRRSLVSTVDALLGVRGAVSEHFASPNAQRAANIDAQQRRFLAVLDGNAKALIAAQGPEWFDAVKGDFEKLQQLQRNARTFKTSIDFELFAISANVDKLLKTIDTGIAKPAAKALAEAATQAAEIAQRTDRRVGVLSIAILGLVLAISLFTAKSVTRPVKRLIDATRLLASGNEFSHAPRGGIRELDQLAAAFNDMSDRLADAQRGVQEQQSKLEQRVAERTQQLRHLAYHDALTQLPNRRHLFDRLASMLDRARDDRRAVALLLLDIDNFKTLNDGLGHLFGDRVLQAVGKRLLDTTAPEVIAARLGGDEFTVAIEMTADKGIDYYTQSLLTIFELPLRVDDRDVLVGISVGASVFPDHASDVESLFRTADSALFRAKALGRNRACVANLGMLREISGQFGTEQALRRAVQCGELELFYQPQIRLGTGEVNGVEALLRWKRDGTYVSPPDFLPLADQLGLIADITDWALQRAIQMLSEWRQNLWPLARIAVNVSAQQLIDQTFSKRVQDLLTRHDVPPSAVELELTETMLQTGAATIRRLDELRELGVGVALDDFGAGFSSLASLDQLELSRVKIDRSLIININDNPRSAAIAGSIIELCKSLNLDVTVEGVERYEQLYFLRRCENVDVQGFLISRPLAADAVIEECKRLPSRLVDTLAASIDHVGRKASTRAPAIPHYRQSRLG